MHQLHSLILTCVAALAVTACTGPLNRSHSDELRRQVLAETRAQLGSSEHRTAGPDGATSASTGDPGGASAGPRLASLELAGLEIAAALDGAEEQPRLAPVELSLHRALDLAIEHNLRGQIARMRPRAAEQQLLHARARFDPRLTSRVDWLRADEPQPTGPILGLAGDRHTEQLEGAVGLHQPLPTGGSLELETIVRRNAEEPSVFDINRYYESEVMLSLRHPLLRGAGLDVNRAEIELARNIEASEIHHLRQELEALAAEVEAAYWRLRVAHQRVTIRRELRDRALAEQRRIEQRIELDAAPIQLAEARSFVELRQIELADARQGLRDASDRLRWLVWAPETAFDDRALIVPIDAPAAVLPGLDVPEAITAALEHRPELERALLEVDDAEIRREVAENLRRPTLDVLGQVGMAALDEDQPGRAIRELDRLDYPTYRLGVQFEMPIGNRQGRALAQQRRIEQRQRATEYRHLAQEVMLEVTIAARQVESSHEQIALAQAARDAAQARLRAIEAQEQAGVELTPEYMLDRKLSAQQRLADMQLRVADALARHMTALAQFHHAQGLLLDRRGIAFVEPDVQ